MNTGLSPNRLTPGERPDDFAEVVLRSLDRPTQHYVAPRALITGVLGFASFGLLPLLLGAMRFRAFAASEGPQFGHLTEWARLRGRPAGVGPLRAAADDIGVRPFLSLLVFLCAAIVVGSFAVQYLHGRLGWDELLDATYRFNHHRWNVLLLHHQKVSLYRAWMAGLSAAYVCQWMQARWYAVDVAHFVRRFDAATQGPLVTPMPRRRWRSSGGFALMGILFAVNGIWWGIPMMMAAAAQRRYTAGASPAVRESLARRVREMALLWHGATYGATLPGIMAPSQPVSSQRAESMGRCANPRCGARVPEEANYCPRCGVAQSPSAVIGRRLK